MSVVNIVSVVCLSSRGVCIRLIITHPEESYNIWCV